jgi:hypothetical protein
VRLLVDRERFAASRAAGSAYRLKRIETRTAAVGMGARRQLSAKGAERGVDGIENSSGKTFQVHAEEYANSLPFEEFSMRRRGRRSDGAKGKGKGKGRPYDPTTLGLDEKS